MRLILDAFKKEQVVGILTVGGSRTLAAQYIGCHPRTIYNAAKADPEFAIKLRRAEMNTEYFLVKTVTEAGNKGVVHAAKWALERKYPERWGRRPPNSFSFDAVKEFLEELTVRLADHAPSDAERRRILETGSTMAKELIGSDPAWPEGEFNLVGAMIEAPSESPTASATEPADLSGDPQTDRCVPSKSPDESSEPSTSVDMSQAIGIP